jgi:hypothetical protein
MLALAQKLFPNLPRLIEKCFPAIARRRSSDEALISSAMAGDLAQKAVQDTVLD